MTKGMASETDLKELFDLVLALLEKLSNDFDQKMQENKGETDNVYREVYAELSDIKQGIKDKLRQLKENVGVDIKAVATQVIDKVKELEAKIPSPTDLSSIEGRLAVLETPKPEKPEDPYEARNELEAIDNESEKLKIEAIQKLREELDKIWEELKKKGGRAIFGGGFNYSAMSIHIIDDETPSGTINGTNAVFTLANLPNPPSSVKVYRGGARQRITEDYTLSGATITFTIAPQVGEVILVDYRT